MTVIQVVNTERLMAALLEARGKSSTLLVKTFPGHGLGVSPAAGRSFRAIKPQDGFGVQIVAAAAAASKNSQSQMSRGSFERRASSSSSSPLPPNNGAPSFYQRVINILRGILTWIALRWKKLPQLEAEAEIVMSDVEKVAETVEKVAKVAEKISAQVAEAMPEESKLKDAALFVEQVSKEAVEGSDATENVIHKVENIKKSLADIETMVDPLIGKKNT